MQDCTLSFDRKLESAAMLLEHSVEIDPGGAYSYSALGMASLDSLYHLRASAAESTRLPQASSAVGDSTSCNAPIGPRWREEMPFWVSRSR